MQELDRIHFIFSDMGYNSLVYVDDFVGAEVTLAMSTQAFQGMKDLLQDVAGPSAKASEKVWSFFFWPYGSTCSIL